MSCTGAGLAAPARTAADAAELLSGATLCGVALSGAAAAAGRSAVAGLGTGVELDPTGGCAKPSVAQSPKVAESAAAKVFMAELSQIV